MQKVKKIENKLNNQVMNNPSTKVKKKLEEMEIKKLIKMRLNFFFFNYFNKKKK